jgi:hypothetical protein
MGGFGRYDYKEGIEFVYIDEEVYGFALHKKKAFYLCCKVIAGLLLIATKPEHAET